MTARVVAMDQDGNVMKRHRRRLRRVRCTAFILVSEEASAWKLREQIGRSATTFGQLAQTHSQMPGEPDGVMLGGDFTPEVERAIRKLGLGEVSEPVQTDYGWFLIQRRRHPLTFK